MKKMWKRQQAKDDVNYDSLIKTALTGHLGEAVREVQRQYQQQQHAAVAEAVVEGNSDAAHTLCCVVEALFIHRLRDSFIDKVSSVLSGDVVRQPSPNFWPFLLGFSHRHSIEYVTDSCPWLRSDIGRCRGWIRLVLNDGMLSSYLEVLAGERRLLNDFYDRHAFLRDPEHLDIARKLLSGVETLQFRLAVNSSMLNNWSTTPLLLAGLWSPPTPLIHEAVVQGIDAALCFTDEDETLQPIKQIKRSSPTPSIPKVDEDLAFRLILESERNIPSGILPPIETTAVSMIPSIQAEPQLSYSLPDSDKDRREEAESSQDVLVTRLRVKHTRPPSPAVEEVKAEVLVGPPVAVPRSLTPPEALVEEPEAAVAEKAVVEEAAGSCTFEDLLEDYSNLNIAGPLIKPPEVPLPGSSVVTKGASTDSSPGFELVTDGKEPTSSFASMLLTLNHERGLAKQEYRCAGCSRPIGLIYGPYKVCGFTGGYYCPDCHFDDEAIIPARVFLNGDFSKRKVCRQVRDWIRETETDAVLDALQFNRHVYSFQRDFAALLTVRSQLQHLSVYLLTCRTAEDGQEFRKRIYGREHLYQQQHTYAMADLPLVQSGQLLQQLAKLAAFSKQHVADCSFCAMKGFRCEVCRSDSILFPFDLDSTYRCATCGSVFHAECMDRFKPCPRCQRWKAKTQAEDPEQEV